MNAVLNKVRLGLLILGLGALVFFMLVRLPASIEAQSEEAFGDHTLKGAYGFTLEGVMLDPGPDPDTEEMISTPFNMLGQIVADGEGNILQGSRTLNFGGGVEADTVTGTYSVNSDGTGSIVLAGLQDGEQVAVEEFACFFTPTGDQFECTVTRIARVDFDPPQEFPTVGLATGLQQSTDIPEPTAAATEDLIGTWKVDGGEKHANPIVIEYNEDGTYRAASAVSNLESFPYHVGDYRLEGTLLTFDTGDGPGDFCRNQSGTYQIELTEEGQYKLELQEDPCEERAFYFVSPWNRISP